MYYPIDNTQNAREELLRFATKFLRKRVGIFVDEVRCLCEALEAALNEIDMLRCVVQFRDLIGRKHYSVCFNFNLEAESREEAVKRAYAIVSNARVLTDVLVIDPDGNDVETCFHVQDKTCHASVEATFQEEREEETRYE